MYCGQCGKKVMENMLFCPFCGSPIVIPDQDELDASRPQAALAEEETVRAAEMEAAAEPEWTARREETANAPEAEARRNAERPEPERLRFNPEPERTARQEETANAPEAEARRDADQPDAERLRFDPEPEWVADVCDASEDAPARLSWDEAERKDARAADSQARKADDRPISLFDVPEEDEPAPDEFVPLHFDFEDEARRDDSPRVALELPEDAEHERAEDVRPAPRRPQPREVMRPENTRRRAPQTFIPVKEIDPEDMFMDADDENDYDDYDVDDEVPAQRYSDSFEFEEPESGSFLQRHIRGVVGLALMLVLAAVFAIWAFSGAGQKALAKINLAWTAQPYADLGYSAYHQDSDLLAARYYEKALAIDEDNYEYAHSAMVAYYEAEKIESAAAMLKKCIAMQPDNAEPYQEMLILYPDTESRPWEIQELIRQGYRRTGDAALNSDASQAGSGE